MNRFLVAWTVAALATSVASAQPKKPEAKKQFEKMDYGPFLSASIQAPAPGKNNAMKGVAVHLGADKSAAVCFDTDLLRVSAGWTGDFLALKGTPFDGGHGSWPAIKGKQVFGTSQGPGWAKPGTDDFKDPRAEPFGPLPADWAKFKGFYRHGEKVVFSYTVGDCRVLEVSDVESKGDATVFTRTFNLGASSKPLTLVVAEGLKADAKAVVTDGFGFVGDIAVGVTAGAKLEAAGQKLLVKLPANQVETKFRVVLSSIDAAKLKGFLAASDSLDLGPLTKGGPALWKETPVTKGVVGTGPGAYVVDTLTVPDDNPYNSWMRLGGFDFFSDGRAAVCTWSGDVWIVSGIDDKLEKLTWKRFATGLFQPLGLKIVDDQVYTLGREGIVRLVDLNGDGEADFYEAFNNEVHTTTGFHEFAFDLHTDPEGNFYFAKAGPVRGGGRGFEYIANHSGCVLKVDKYGQNLDVFASGLRAPNGIGVGPNGEVTSGDNEGTWMPMCRINLMRRGGFSGCSDTYHGATKPKIYDDPICWLPKNVDNSGGGQTWVTSDRWGPLKGELLHTSYGTSSLYHVLLEREGDSIQGGVVKMPLSFQSGIMRPRFNKIDGQFYVVGLKGWQSNAARDGAFQRVRYTGKPMNMVAAMKVVKGGLQLTFSDPLDARTAADAENFSAQNWNYRWCSEYGSDSYSAKDSDFFKRTLEYNRLRENAAANKEAIAALANEFKKGKDSVKIEGAKVSADGKVVTLSIPEIKPVMQFHLKYKLKAADGATVAQEIYSTVNRVPQ